jgi:hypothetical protein
MSDRIAHHVLEQVRTLGYHVSVFELPSSLLGHPGGVELHAVDDRGEVPRVFIAKIGDAEGDDLLYRAACLLAEQVGIDLEG